MAKKKLENKNPPRRAIIGGQDHLLAYITPAEAQLLMDNGGSGEPGPMGIPSFYEKDRPGLGGAGEKGASGGFGGDFGGGPDKDNDKGAVDPGLAKAVAEKAAQQAAAQMGMSPGAMGGAIGSAYQQAPSVGTGFDPYSEKARSIVAASGPSSKLTYDDVGNLVTAIKNLQDRRIKAKQLGAPIEFELFGRKFGVPTIAGSLGSFLSNRYLDVLESNLLGGGVQDFTVDPVTGKLTEVFTKDPFGFTVRTGDDLMPKFDDGKGPDTVAATYNPVTGEQQCPDGYVFDASLQACRVAAPLANVGETVGGTGFDYQPGTYARMGLLDEAPIGLEQFASTYGTGFGTAPDYEAANLAYRKPVGTMSGIFQDPYNLQGMTLLA